MSTTSRPTLGELLDSFQRTAFRLETLDRYAVEDEDESFQRYLAGEPLPPPDPSDVEWQQFIRDKAARGATMSRVHAIAGPLTPYLHYEIDWGYVYNASAGEDIHILHRADLRPVFGDEPLHDFWLLDEAVVVHMDYDREGRFRGPRLSHDAATLEECRRLRDIALRHAVPLHEYLAAMRREASPPPAGLSRPHQAAS
jgi:hypothetical protein